MLSFGFALRIDDREGADDGGYSDNEDEGEEGVDSFDFHADGVGHEYCYCLGNTDKNEVFGVVVAHFRYEYEGAVVDVLAIDP